MDLYLLDENLQPIDIVEERTSLIWTERYSDIGEAEIKTDGRHRGSPAFSRGALWGLDRSRRVMVVDQTELGADDTLTVRASSLESVLKQRFTQSARIASGQPLNEHVLTGQPASLADQIFRLTCQNNAAVPQDNFPFIRPSGGFPAGNMPFPAETVTYDISKLSVYEAIKGLCDMFLLGFAITRAVGPTASLSYFQIYTGSDRTSWQTTLPAVILSKDLDTLEGLSMLESDSSLKNVAYVYSENGSRIVYADMAGPETAGIDRRILAVDATDIKDPAGATLNAALEFRGRKALAEQRGIIAVDGQIPESSPYVYGRDYNLGDHVERHDSSGFSSQMLVTEQIFIDDVNGEQSYPTLQMLELITPGSWYAWSRAGIWDEATGTWNDV